MARSSFALLGMTFLCGISSASAQSRWRIEDRVVLGTMLRIQAVASSFERLYVVGGGKVMYQEQGRPGWLGPFDGPTEGELLDARGSVVDPLDRSLWIVTGSGWLRYDPTLDSWDRGFAGGDILMAGIDRGRPIDGLYLRLRTGWVVATRGAGMAIPAASAPRDGELLAAGTILDLARANPQLGGLLSGTLMAPGLRSVRLTAAAPASDNSGWWLGTDGAGLFWLPFGGMLPERRSWGLPGEEVGGIFAVPGGAWAVTDQDLDGTAALVFIPEALDRFDWFFGDRALGHPFRTVRVVHAVDSLVWVGTDQGAFAFDRRGTRLRAIDEGNGLADRRIFAIASRHGRLVLGTAVGIAEVTDSGARRLAPNFVAPALALALAGDTTFVGTTLGLFAALPGMADLREAPGWETAELLRTPVTGLLWRGDTLVALTDRAVVWRDPGTGRWTPGPDIAQRVGRTHAIADGRDGEWIAGELGLGFARLGGPIERFLAAGDALPGPAWDVSIDGDRIWVATPHGLVRFRRQAVEP